MTLRAALVEEIMKDYVSKGDVSFLKKEKRCKSISNFKFMAVLICLQKEYPKEKEFKERRRFFAQLLADDPQEISKHFQNQHENNIADNKNLMTMLEDLLPTNFLLGPTRLDDLLHQCKKIINNNYSIIKYLHFSLGNTGTKLSITFGKTKSP